MTFCVDLFGSGSHCLYTIVEGINYTCFKRGSIDWSLAGLYQWHLRTYKVRRARDRMIVEFNYLCNQCLSPLTLYSIQHCDNVCQWLATGWWFYPGTQIFSTKKTDRHDITEILLKVPLSTIKPINHLRTCWKHLYCFRVNASIISFIIYLFYLGSQIALTG